MSSARSGVRTWIVALDVVPRSPDLRQRRVVVGAAGVPDEIDCRLARRRPGRARTTISVLSPAAKLDARLQHGARIQPGPDRLLELVPAGESRRPLGPTVAAEELGAVGGPRRLPPAHVEEGDASAELGVPWVRRQHRLGLRFGFGDDPRCAGATRRSEHPLGVGGDRQAPRSPGSVLHGEHRQLHRRRPAGRTGRDRAGCRCGSARSGCIRPRGERRRSIPRIESVARSDSRVRRCRRRARTAPRTGGSLTGSFDHGVSWFSRLLPAQV